MIYFSKMPEFIELHYSPEYGASSTWLSDKLKTRDDIIIKRIFKFNSNQLLKVISPTEEESIETDTYSETGHFLFATRENEYYKVIPGVITNRINIYFHESVKLQSKYFIATSDISIFGHLNEILNKDLYIGGAEIDSLPIEIFESFVKQFPNTHEKRLYANSRISLILKHHLTSIDDAENSYNRYMDKKISFQGKNLRQAFKQSEIYKYETILEKLQDMLQNETAYLEKQWQEEILQIIILLYPKYINAFTNARILKDLNQDRYPDYLLVDSNGHIDIAEIKRPFEQCIVTDSGYRKNHIPLRELSGTIMQIEKYCYFLSRSGRNGEEELMKQFGSQLPKDLQIQITNPTGIVIMGRDYNLTQEQLLDFEIIKRKYKNVADIMTYDDLIRRLNHIIQQLKNSL